MTGNRQQAARVAGLEAKQMREAYAPPLIIREILEPNGACDRVLVRSRPFDGCEFSRKQGETSTGFEARVHHEINQMEQEAAQ